MTQQTNYQLPVSELYQAGTFFANLGLECPWVGEDAWCDLGGLVMGDDSMSCHCPPAVAAAVVWFANALCRLGMDKGWWKYMSFGPRVGGSVGWYWLYGDDEEFPAKSGTVESQLEAAVALILGVRQAMGGE